MKPLKYRGYKISRIERCGNRRVVISNDKNVVINTFDGYDMDKLVKLAEQHIDFLIAGLPLYSPLEKVHGSEYCQFSIVENKLATLYRNQELIYELLLKIYYDKP